MDQEYLCKHCGKEIRFHKAKDFNCPAPGRGNFKGFVINKYYEPNYNKPIPQRFKL